MKKIQTLTEEQVGKLSVFREKWIQIGLSTSTGFTAEDKGAIAKDVDAVYEAAGLEPPAMKIWLPSPLSGAIGATLLCQEDSLLSQVGFQVGDQVWDQVRSQVWDQVRDQVRSQVVSQIWDQVESQVGDQVESQVEDPVWDLVWSQVWDLVRSQVLFQVRDQVRGQVGFQVGDQVWDQVRDWVWSQVRGQVRFQVGDWVWDQVRSQVGFQVGDQVWDQVRSQVWDQVRAQVRSQVLFQVRDQVESQVESQVGAQLYTCAYGTQDAGWLSFYDFFQAIGCVSLDKIMPLLALSQKVGWWWPFKGAVVLTEKPSFLCRDDQGRLHHEHRMALEYRDGFGVYAWHGVRVEPWVILEPEKIDTQSILAEENQEVRRVLLERYGWERLLDDLRAKTVHEDDTGKLVSTRRLSEYLDGEDEEARFVLVVDSSTDRRYALRVPPSTQTARQGVAWTFGQEEEHYAPLQEA